MQEVTVTDDVDLQAFCVRSAGGLCRGKEKAKEPSTSASSKEAVPPDRGEANNKIAGSSSQASHAFTIPFDQSLVWDPSYLDTSCVDATVALESVSRANTSRPVNAKDRSFATPPHLPAFQRYVCVHSPNARPVGGACVPL